jgi:hypothetical protein
MCELLLTALYLHIPIVIGGVLHMVVVSRQLWPQYAVPIYTPWLGANKTWRGMIAVPLLTAFGALCLWPVNTCLNLTILSQNLFALLSAGFLAGIGYVLAELPNSFIKRRLGIGAGEVPTRGKYLVILADQLDSGIGFSLAYYWYLQLSIEQALVCALSFPMTALVVKRLLFIAKLKKSAT